MLRTRSPLGLHQSEDRMDLVRLACVKHAASVRPEPGSNSPTRTGPTHGRLSIDRADLKSSAEPSGMTRRSAILTELCLPPGGYPAAELTDSRVSGAEAPPDRLPALAFCLLFRFQGAEALAHPADRLGALWTKPSQRRLQTLLPRCGGNNPDVRKKPGPGDVTFAPSEGAGDHPEEDQPSQGSHRVRSPRRCIGNPAHQWSVSHRRGLRRGPPSP